MKKRVLLIDDLVQRCSDTADRLQTKGYEVHKIYPKEIKLETEMRAFDLILYCVKPSLCPTWSRLNHYAPVLLITDRCHYEGILRYLEEGADDYLMRPYEWDDLFDRINHVLSQSSRHRDLAEVICVGPLTIRPAAREIRVNNRLLDCTPKEYALLSHLANHLDQVFSREELLGKLWGAEYAGSHRTIDTHIKELRKKLERAGFTDAQIVTVWRKGYMLTRNKG